MWADHAFDPATRISRNVYGERGYLWRADKAGLDVKGIEDIKGEKRRYGCVLEKEKESIEDLHEAFKERFFLPLRRLRRLPLRTLLGLGLEPCLDQRRLFLRFARCSLLSGLASTIVRDRLRTIRASGTHDDRDEVSVERMPNCLCIGSTGVSSFTI